MTTRVIKTEGDIEALRLLLRSRKLPLTVEITAGAQRTTPQNRLAFQWYGDVSKQLGDQTVEDIRCYCKLHFGVPIRKAGSEAYAADYDRDIRPLPYETKKRLMGLPYDLAVTRDMTTAQLTEYLDTMARFWSGQGIVLTDPEELKYGSRKVVT